MLAKIEHESIPTIYDVIEIGRRPCIIMKMINGLSLRKYCTRESLVAIPHAVNWVVQLAKAVHECHLHGMLHRDLKPENILNCDGRRSLSTLGWPATQALQWRPLLGLQGT